MSETPNERLDDTTNAERADRGDYLIRAYIARYGGDGESALCDILADLMHAAHREDDNAEEPIGAFEQALTVATVNFNCEIEEA